MADSTDKAQTTVCSEALLASAEKTRRLLGISLRTLAKLTKAGSIPHVRIGRRVLYPVDRLHDWIGDLERGGQP